MPKTPNHDEAIPRVIRPLGDKSVFLPQRPVGHDTNIYPVKDTNQLCINYACTAATL
jgi:hypothetical protein